MSDPTRPTGNRREFLTGRVLRAEVEWIGERIADKLIPEESRVAPSAGATIRMGTRAMATEFAVLMNPGPARQLTIASKGLDLLHPLEAEMTVYREEGELARANHRAAEATVPLSERLFRVVKLAKQIAEATDGAYDPTSGPLIELWRQARGENRIPSQQEIEETRARTGIVRVTLDDHHSTVQFDGSRVELNLGGIGKGFALDVVARILLDEGLSDWLVHGGKSSILARGENHRAEGWPVGIRNPLFPNQRLATVLLRDQGMSTSGAGVQFFRHEGRRYGHILDPRTGWPAENILSVTVFAPTAAEADALSTAFFVLGLEKTREFCDNRKDVGVLMAPPPRSGSRLQVHAFNIPEQTLFLGAENVLISESE